MSSRTASDRSRSTAAIFDFNCSIFVAPMITDIMKGRVRQKAIAIWAGSRPCFLAIATYSSATGRATVLGWEGHEFQWRGTRELFEGRAADVETLYKTDDLTKASALLDRYDIDYVYLGARERGEYGPANFDKFDQLGDRVFEFDSTVIFKIFRVRE